MTDQQFTDVEPKIGDQCTVTWERNGRTFTETFFYEGRRGADKVLFGERNWASDFLLIKISQVVSIL